MECEGYSTIDLSLCVLCWKYAIFIDGSVYILERFNHRVVAIDLEGKQCCRISPRDNACTNKHTLLWTIGEEFALCTKGLIEVWVLQDWSMHS